MTDGGERGVAGTTSMLDHLTVRPKITRSACSTVATAIVRYLLRARTRPQQQTRRPPLLLSIDGTDRQTLDRFITLTAYYRYADGIKRRER